MLSNFIDVLTSKWKSKVIRLPMCSSGWAQQYQVHDFDPVTPHPVMDYKSWVDVAVKEARSNGAVVILDNHLWALGPAGSLGNDRGTFVSNGQTLKYSDYEDGCRAKKPDGTLDCAPKDFYSDDKNMWECPIANADGASIYNAYYNKDKIAAVWADVAARYKGDDGVWFELYNEPYARKATTTTDPGPNVAEADYPWDLWTDFMFTQIKAIRDTAGASNMVIVNGFDFGYDFGPDNGPIAHPDKYLPWVSKYPNVAYSFHPYQVASCCGEIGATTDSSATDPYESAFCSYYSDGSIDGANVPTAADLPVPDGKKCTNHGYGSLADKKMPPCTWVPTAKNPKTGAIGLCAGDRTVCGPKNETDCKAVDPASPAAGGWSKHALPMAKYGPLIATEFGSFDCSSAYVKNLLGYMDKFAISHTAWAAWPQNKGGPDGLGACGYPSVNKPAADGDFRKCINPADCAALIEPQPWSGMLTFEDLTSH